MTDVFPLHVEIAPAPSTFITSNTILTGAYQLLSIITPREWGRDFYSLRRCAPENVSTLPKGSKESAIALQLSAIRPPINVAALLFRVVFRMGLHKFPLPGITVLCV